MQRCSANNRRPPHNRAGSTLDYVLVVTAILPFVALALPQTRRIIGLVFELTCDLVASPFM